MALFLFIAFVMFFLFAKFYTIAKKKDVINGNDAHSALVFSVFMFACTVLWIAFTYAFKTSVFVLVCLLCWPNIKKFFREYNGDILKETSKNI